MSRTQPWAGELRRAFKDREDHMKRRASTQKQSKGVKKVRSAGPAAARGMVVTGSSKSFAPELKALDTNGHGSIVPLLTSTNHTQLLNIPFLGTERYQRIGRKINIKKVHVKIAITAPTPTATQVPEDLLFLLVWDKEGGPIPNLANIIQDISANGTAVTDVYSYNNLDETGRFTILKRKNVPLRVCGTLTGALPCNGAEFQATQDNLFWEWNLKTNFTTQFNAGNTGTIGDLATGALYLFWYTSLDPAAVDFATIEYHTRIRYFD